MDDVDQQFELHPATIDTDGNGAAAHAGRDAPRDDSSKREAGASKPVRSGPIPMSMPSILRNPGTAQSNHLAYLVDRRNGGASSSYPPASSSRKPRSAAKEQLGRRKQRRSENARLLSNPHAVRPTIKDYRLHSNEIRSTFPAAGAGGKAHSVPVPSSSGVGYSEPVHDAASASQGHFGKSLRDAQRVLKRLEVGAISDAMIREQRAGELERFIWLVDREIRTWAQDDVHVFAASAAGSGDRKVGRVLLDAQFRFTRSPLDEDEVEVPTVGLDAVRPGEGGQLVEFQRTPNALVWLVHDPFLRLVVHCLARVSRCPSFSKDDPGRPGLRFTWILNRNPLARRSRRGRRVSVSSSAMSATADEARAAELGTGVEVVRPRLHAMHLARTGVLETPPTTDFDSQTESELGAETELDTDTDAVSLADSIPVLPAPRLVTRAPEEEEEGEQGSEEDAASDREREGADPADTDEDEAEILRRVRRWAIDSHRQRAAQRSDLDNASPDPPAAATAPRRFASTRTSRVQDPDQTLTRSTIAEDDERDQDEDSDDARSS